MPHAGSADTISLQRQPPREEWRAGRVHTLGVCRRAGALHRRAAGGAARRRAARARTGRRVGRRAVHAVQAPPSGAAGGTPPEPLLLGGSLPAGWLLAWRARGALLLLIGRRAAYPTGARWPWGSATS